MNSHRFTNARVHEWLTPDLDKVAKSMRSTRVQLNSAALWWFCCRMTAKERAEILGEFVKYQALGTCPGSEAEGETENDGKAMPAAAKATGTRKRKTKADSPTA